MKIRIGVGLGTHTLTNDAATFGPYVEEVERLGFDSLWLSERLTGDAPDPLIALAVAAGRTTRLKLGTSVLVVPGRNPVVLAKELASLDRLSGGRLLPAVGLGAPDPGRAPGLRRRPAKERSAWFDEALPLMRRLWTEDDVHHAGDRFEVAGRHPPAPPDPGSARRVARRGGALRAAPLRPPGRRLAAVVLHRRGRPRRLAGRHRGGRRGGPGDRSRAPRRAGHLRPRADPRAGGRPAVRRAGPELDPAAVVPVGLPALRDRLEAFTEVGASKFVVLPLDEPPSWDEELGALAEVVRPLET